MEKLNGGYILLDISKNITISTTSTSVSISDELRDIFHYATKSGKPIWLKVKIDKYGDFITNLWVYAAEITEEELESYLYGGSAIIRGTLTNILLTLENNTLTAILQ